jgi:hypothetical protein
MSDDKAKNAQRLRGMLRAYDRTPFLDMLQALLEAQPDPEVLADFAKRSPDKWAQATKIAAGLGGFQEASVIDLNLRRPEDLSDMELEARIRAQFAEMQASGLKLIPAEAEPDDPEETT